MAGVGEVIATSISEANSSGVKSFGVCTVIGELAIRRGNSSFDKSLANLWANSGSEARALGIITDRLQRSVLFQ